MPKRGQTQPWKVRFQYPGQPQRKSAYSNRSAAEINGQEIANRGARVDLYYYPTDSPWSTHIHTFVAEDVDEAEEG